MAIPVEFTPHGPIEVKYSHSRGVVTFEAIDLWARHPDLASGKGVYIFAVQRGESLVPFYVGETKASFQKEAFTPHKLAHYRNALGKGKNWKTFLFLLVPGGKADDTRFISDVENFLIRAAWHRNPALCNQKGIPDPEWVIPGVTGTGSGKSRSANRKLREVLGLSGSETHAGLRKPKKT